VTGHISNAVKLYRKGAKVAGEKKSFTAEAAKVAEEEKSFTAEDAKVAEEEKSFTAEDAKDAEEEKSFTAEDAKDAEDYRYRLKRTAYVVSRPPTFSYATLSATSATLRFTLINIPLRPLRPWR
jgi:chloramphenicol O-acetyltransferase